MPLVCRMSGVVVILTLACLSVTSGGTETQPQPETPLISLQVVELLKAVERSTLDLERAMDPAPGVSEELLRAQEDPDEFRLQMDRYADLLDIALAYDSQDQLTRVLAWIVEKLRSSSGLNFQLRAARIHVWSAKTMLKHLQQDWRDINGKLDRKADLTSEEAREEVQLNAQLFVDSLDRLKQAVVLVVDAVRLMDRYLLTEEEGALA